MNALLIMHIPEEDNFDSKANHALIIISHSIYEHILKYIDQRRKHQIRAKHVEDSIS